MLRKIFLKKENQFFLFLSFIYLILIYFFTFPITKEFFFGVDDPTIISELDNFLSKKDFLNTSFVYSPFHLIFLLVPYLLFGKNYFAFLIATKFFLPFFSIFFTFLISKLVFKNQFIRFIFLFYAVAIGIIANSSSIRFVVPLYIIIFSIYLIENNRRLLSFFLTGVFFSICFLISYEYGIVAVFTFVLTQLAFVKFNEIHILFINFINFFIGFIILLFVFLLYLFFTNSLDYYLSFILDLYSNFELINGAFYVLLPDINKINYTSIKSILNFIISKDFKFFLPYILYLISFLYLIFSNKDQFFKKIILCLIIFGFLIQLRTLNGAAYGYLLYSYLPVLIIIFIFLEKIYSNKSYTNQSILILILIFLTLSINYNPYSTTRGSLKEIIKYEVNNFNSVNKNNIEYNKYFGTYILSEVSKKFNEVNEYLSYLFKSDLSNTHELYVYPWGLYNNMLEIKNFTRFAESTLYLRNLNTKYLKLLTDEINSKDPKIVVLNLYNNYGTVAYSKFRQGIVPQIYSEEGINFSGDLDPLKKILIEKYEIKKIFEYAIVLEKRKYKVNYIDKYENINVDFDKIKKSTNIKYENDKFHINLAENNYAEILFEPNNKILSSYIEFSLYGLNENMIFKPILKNSLEINLNTDKGNIKRELFISTKKRKHYIAINPQEEKNIFLRSITIKQKNQFPYLKFKKIVIDDLNILRTKGN